MKKNIFAVCDLEVDYALNFMDYLNHKKNIPFEIQAFTNVESLIAYGKMNHIELLLISQKAMCRQVQELEIGKIVILSEGVHPPDLDRYPSVYKYQASSDVVREVMACYGAEKAVAPAVFPVLKKTTEIYAVYSPLGRCLKTSFALTLGQILAKERAVLYLNLEEYSGFEEMLGKGFAQNLSDLLYFVRQENGNLIYKMNSMVQTINNLDFIPPVRTPEDIRGTAWEDWEKLIQEIVLHSNYEFVILDIGGAVDGTFQVLKQLIYLVNQFCNPFDLLTDLLRHHKDMGIILCKAAYTHKSVKLSGFFMTMYQTKLTHTKRQITVRTWF